MMPDQVEKYRAYVRFIRGLMNGSGLWSNSKNPGFLYRQLPIFILLCGSIIIVALGNFCWLNASNLNLVTKALSLLGSFLASMLKISLFTLHGKELREVYDQLQTLFEEALSDERLRPSLLSLLRYFYGPSRALMLSACGVMAMYTLRPLIIIGKQFFSKGPVKVYPLAYPTVYPWPVQSSVVLYAFHYIFEVQFCWFVIYITAGVDSLFGFYMFQISALMRALTYEVQHIKTGDNHGELLRKCSTMYAQFIYHAKVVQRAYGPIVLLMAVTNALIMCSILFQAVQSGDMSIEKALVTVFYILLKVAQTFMYAWFGHTVSEQSEVLQREIYCSNWYENQSQSYKAGILLVITQRPISLTACNFFRISLDFFVNILSTTLSYFCLLQTLDSSA